MSDEEKRRFAKSQTNNPEAYQLYLKGQYFWNKRTPEGLKKSIEFYSQAIALDSGYALAYAGLAGSYGVIGGLSLAPPREAFGKSQAALQKALGLDETLAEAHYGLAIVNLLYVWDWEEAEREFKRAAELNPKLALPHGLYSYHLTMGRVPEAVAEAKRVLMLDALSLPFNRDVAETLYCAREFDQTIEHCRHMLEMDANYPLSRHFLGLAYEKKGMTDQAIDELTKSVALSQGSPESIGALGYVQAVAGKRDEARRTLERLKDMSKQRYVQATSHAVIYTGLGERDAAFEWLQKAYEERDIGLVHLYLKSNPIWDSIRSDPRFTEMLKRMRLD